ncbi:Serine/threonine-protein kinase HSL1 [Spathaspora sp. JA1]|nr:Serine/threonine-protein kinase HSL1 [Spathaspora sp. JA1]
MTAVVAQFEDTTLNDTLITPTTYSSQTPANVDKVVQSVTNATKRLSQISTISNNSNRKRKSQNKIGPWKLGRTLGRGSTGRVRLAKNINTGKLAAVKIVPKSTFKKLENPKYKRKEEGEEDSSLPYGIEREIIIMKLISHPNIMGLYDVWENKNDLYLILEYIEGGELFDYLIKRGKLQEFEAINYFKQIINGINYLHQFNICHRDLKPENLLLDFNKNIKIADFGMAALEIKEKLLETSCGSPHYASPEIVAGKNYHGAPSDIWSCGIILFALLTGHLPFDDENIRKLLLKVQSGKFNMPHDLTWEAKDLISKMLRVNPRERISIEDILSHPLLVKYPDPTTLASTGTTLDLKHININPIESMDKIDREILKSLSILFHNCNEQTIISRLMSPNKCSEKMFYYLLMKYRNEHLSTSSSMDINDETTDVGSARNSIPRSTSIVKTTVVDETTGEVHTHTTIAKVEKSTSIYSNKSLLKKSLLDNKQHSASSSVNKKKVHNKNQITYSRARNTSSRSLKSNRSTSSTTKSQTSSSESTAGRVLTPMVKLPSQQVPPATPSPTTPTPVRSTKSVDTKKPPPQVPEYTKKLTNLRNQQDKASTRRRLTGTFGNKSLLNFELICEEVFSGDGNKENIIPEKPVPSNRKQSSLARKERELAEKVRAQNEAREQRLKKAEEEEARQQQLQLQLQKEQESRRNSQVSIPDDQLLERQRTVFNRLINRQSTNDFANLVAGDRRSVTEPMHSLDPKASSLLRARTIATPIPGKLERLGSSYDSPTSKVLTKLGIELDVSDASSLKKTGTTKNLAGILKPKDTNIPSQRSSFLKVSSSRNLSDYLKEEQDEKTSQSSMYKLDENKASIPIVEEEEVEEETMPDTSLIPNPRFSTFSFGGLLKPHTVANEEGDTTIMQNTLTSGGTVVRRSIYKNSSIKKSSTVLGLGIKVREPEQSQPQEVKEQRPVNVSSSSEESKKRYSNHQFDEDELLSDTSTVDTEFSVGDSTTKQAPVPAPPSAPFGDTDSIVDSNETLILKKHNSVNDESPIDSEYHSFQDVSTDNHSSFVAANTTGFDNNFSVPEITEIIDESVIINDTGYNEHTMLKSRLSTGIFSTAPIPRSPRVELSDKVREEDDEQSIYEEQVQPEQDNQKKRVSISEKKEFISPSPVRNSIVPVRSPGNVVIERRGDSPVRVPNYKRMSMHPKRPAPKPPAESTSTKTNRFSWISGNEEKKSSWFKRFFQSLTGSSSPKIEKPNKHATKDIEIVDSSLMADELMQVITNQLELKKLEGSISKVTIDEEFGLISGVIPSKYASGRKLKFTIEVISLKDCSSLHIIRTKGNDKGFSNFVNIVTFVIRQEEFMNRKRMSSRGTTGSKGTKGIAVRG